MTAQTTADFLTQAERAFAAKSPAGFVACQPCQDFRTDVSFGVEHPCRHCQPMRFISWRLCHEGEGLSVLVDGKECIVMAPPAGGPMVQPCEPPVCKYGCILTRSILGSDPRWVALDQVEILTPWQGA